MRTLPAALAVLLAAPGTAAAAPWVETPFLAFEHDRTATCLHATGPGGAAYLAENRAEDRETAELLRVGPDGALVADATVPLGVAFGCPAVATAASGAAVAGFAGLRRDGDGIFVTARDPGGAFTRPRRVDGVELGSDDVAAAVAERGDGVVAWIESDTRGDTIVARVRAVRRAPGGPFSAPRTVAQNVQAYSAVEAGMDAAGRATLAWHGTRANGQEAAFAATAAPGAAFGAPERLGRGADGIGGVALAVAPGGGVLAAHDGFDGVHVFERPPGAARFARAARFPGDFDQDAAAVALAADGTAAVAWQRDVEAAPDPVPEVSVRASGGAFGPGRRLGTDALAAGPEPFQVADEDGALAVAAEPGGAVTAAWLERPLRAGDDLPGRIALAAGTAAGGWTDATRFGSPARSAGTPVLMPGALLWSDNLPDPAFDLDSEPRAAGRVHLARPGAPAPVPAPLPALSLSAPAQRLRAGDALVVDARCSAACDLRAVTRARDRRFGGPAGLGAAQLAGPGTARIRLKSWRDDSLVPDHGGRPTVIVTATAPGGTTPVVRRLVADVRHFPVPAPRRPVDVRAVRHGDRVVVTWRTRRPARAERFLVSALAGGDAITTEFARGGGRTRFRVVLTAAAQAGRVEIEYDSFEPRYAGRRLRVPVT